MYAVDKLKQVIIDVLGVLLIILSVFFGWLPGVGGIPIFIAGLALLATNHEWARKLLKKAETKGEEIWEIVFKDNAQLKWFYDISGTYIIAFSIYVMAYNRSQRIYFSAGLFILSFGTMLLLGNRKRLQNLQKFMKNFVK